MALKYRWFLFAVLLVAAAVDNAAAATYVVGDDMGWRVPNTPADYSNWANHHVFRVGDVLVFNFTSGEHDVARVTKAAFDGCSSGNSISGTGVGPSNFSLTSAGEKYYICTFGRHCAFGQKLAIHVTASSSPAPSSPTAPTTSSTSTPTGSLRPPPSPPASSAAISTMSAPLAIFACGLMIWTTRIARVDNLIGVTLDILFSLWCIYRCL